VSWLDGHGDAGATPIASDHQEDGPPTFPIRLDTIVIVEDLGDLFLPDPVRGEFLLVLLIEQEGIDLDHRPAITVRALRSVYDVVDYTTTTQQPWAS
jgi:hypothetical protein